MSNDYINSIKARADALRSLSADIVGVTAIPDRQHAIDALQREAHYIDIEASDAEKAEALQDIGRSAYESIADMVTALECDYDRLAELDTEENNADINALIQTDDATELVELREAAGECESREDAEQRIHEDALEVSVRSDWHSPHNDSEPPSEFKILLSTGGPATRIIGELNEHGEPTRARLQVQNWGTPWTDYRGGDMETLLTYARCFYFGEG